MTDQNLTPNDVRQLWIKEMANGDYKFVKGAFNKPVFTQFKDENGTLMHYRKDIGHCALGVLKDMAFKHGVTPDNPFDLEGSRVGEWVGLTPKECEAIAQTNDHPDSHDYGPVIAAIESLPLPE